MHYITSGDIADNPQWFDEGVCRYTTADTWDFVGIQEAIFSAYGTPGNLHGLGGVANNREVYAPAGDYRVNRTLFLTKAAGVIFYGAGRFSTRIYITAPDKPILETNMAYSVIRDIYFGNAGGTSTVPTALVEWVWGSQPNESGMAHLSISDCMFHGSASPTAIGFRVARDLYQGDNVIFYNCFFADCDYAGFATGDGAFNALQLAFIACNFQACNGNGILAYGGNVVVEDCSFQNGALDAAIQQTGFDICLISNSGSVASIIHGCRTESKRFLHADSHHFVDIRACSTLTGPSNWLPSTAYVVGNIVGPATGKDGRPYICVQAGTSSGTEPTWTGIDGIVDGGVIWDVYNYNIVEFDNGTMEGCNFPWGRIKIGEAGSHCRLIGNYFSRDDWLYKAAGQSETVLYLAAQNNLMCGNQVTHAGGINQGAAAPYRLPSYGYPNQDYNEDHIEAYTHYYLPGKMPLLWARQCILASFQHRVARDVGLWPSYGHIADGSNNDISLNVLGPIGTFGPRHVEGANAAGNPLIVQGGLSRGLGAGGDIRFRVNVPGTAGSDLNLPHATQDSLRVRYNRVKAGVPLQVLKVSMSQRDALTDKEPGDQIYNITLSRLQVWNGWIWDDLSAGTMLWNPLDYFGVDLQAWWQIRDPATRFQDSAMTTLAVADNAFLGGIGDKTGNGRHLLAPSTGARSILKLNITAGHPVARHDGISQYLLSTGWDRYPGPNTLVMICRSTGGYIIGSGNNLAGLMYVTPPGSVIYWAYNTNLGVVQDIGTRFGCAIGTYDGPNSKFWVNGVRNHIGDTAHAAGGNPVGVTVGARYDGSSPATMDWCEAFVISREPTPLEVDYIGLYAQQYDTPEPIFIA
jgi:hypothetical protein